MNKQVLQVSEFHKYFKHPDLDKPTIPSLERCNLRVELIDEELKELKEAYEQNDLVGVADALTDLMYVLNGAYLEFGMKNIGEKLFDEVHRSNMSKACKTIQEAQATIEDYKHKGTEASYREEDGLYFVYRISDSKTLKSINYSPADLKSIVDESQG